jgi:hypothetical protein
MRIGGRKLRRPSMASMISVDISVNFVPKSVTIKAVNDADNQEYTYTGQSFKRLQEIFQKVAATFQDPNAESFDQNVSTDGKLKLLPGP